MTTAVKQIANSALALSVQERAELAHVIIASIDENRNDWHPAWDIELKKRVRDVLLKRRMLRRWEIRKWR